MAKNVCQLLQHVLNFEYATLREREREREIEREREREREIIYKMLLIFVEDNITKM